MGEATGVAAPASISHARHAPSYTLGMLANWFTRSRSAVTPSVVIGSVINGLHSTRFSTPDT